MNNKLYLIFVIIIVFGSRLLSQISLAPRSSASAQTFGTFSRSLDAINYNPANLAYKNKIFNYKINRDSLKHDQVYQIHIVNTNSKSKSDSLINYIKDFLYKDSLFVDLKSIEQNNSFSVIIDNIINHTTTKFYLRLLNKYGYSNLQIDSLFIEDNQNVELENFYFEDEQNIYLEFLNIGAMLSNSNINVNWLNNNILNGKDLGKLNELQKNKLISIFPKNGLKINPLISYKFGLRINNTALQIAPEMIGEVIIPSALFDLTLLGNKISEPIDFSGQKHQFQLVTPITISYGQDIKLPFLNKLFKNYYIGINAKYLIGLAYFESIFDTLTIIPNSDYNSLKASIQTRYSLGGAYIGIKTEKPMEYILNSDNTSTFPSGSGFAFDLGIIMDINNKLRSSIAINNFLGKIKWHPNTIFQHNLKLHSNFTIDDLQKDPDSFLHSGLVLDTNYALKSFSTKYPSNLLFGLEYSLQKIKIATNLKFGFSNKLGSSKIPRLSFATEVRPAKWMSLLSGISIGGYESFQWGSGVTINLLFLKLSFAYSEYGGIMKNAKGISLSTSTTILF